jgi:rhodanese-related sulfurtransferase
MSELRHYAQLRAALLNKEELAIIDVREEAAFASGHPLFAANFPLGRLEHEVYARIPRRSTPIAVYDNGEGLAGKAVEKLNQLGYRDVALLAGGLEGWREAGGELFIDVNVPSKAFGELVEAKRHTPALSAEEVRQRQLRGDDIVILDVRRFDEYQTMNIPGSVSLPGGDLVLKARAQVSSPQTQIVVNCAGRTRSIIGAQSLINAGVNNPVATLRNGTIGWTLAGQDLEHDQSRQAQDGAREEAERIAAWELATGAGVSFVALSDWQIWQHNSDRNTWLFDVRSSDEYRAGHIPGARSVPGGQLVQETDHYAAVRGGRIVLVDDDGVRAPMAASWLAQMGWEVAVLEVEREAFSERGDWPQALPGSAKPAEITAQGRYHRPYEGTAVPRQAMEDYLQWEYGLVAQLERDGTHGFWVL